MALDETTQLDPRLRHELDSTDTVPVLTLVHHIEPRYIGARCVLAEGRRLVLGRQSVVFGGGALDDPLVSRSHLAVVRDDRRVRVIDLESRNGSFVNGEPIGERELLVGDVVGLGDVLLIYHNGPAKLERNDHPKLVGQSAALRHVLGRAALVARRSVTVLLQGETGTGKELVARAIHEQSGRTGAFIAVNCGAVAAGVLQSELFGHARGAFSGATDARAGLVAAAEGGTLMLDEIGDASPELQASLLRLLEEGEYRAVGSDSVVASSARFIAASHVDLAEAVAANGFREDLYARLARWVIEVPPLRERREDIILLARGFADALGAVKKPIARELALALLGYHWPRNVRELEAIIEQIAVEHDESTGTLTLTPTLAARLHAARDLGRARGEAPADGEPAHASAAVVPADARPSRATLEARLLEHRGNVSALALEMNVARTTVYRWLRQHHIDLRTLRYPE